MNLLRVADADSAIRFLDEAAVYFENRPTHGEGRSHWANVYNAENCRLIADMLRKQPPVEDGVTRIPGTEQ